MAGQLFSLIQEVPCRPQSQFFYFIFRLSAKARLANGVFKIWCSLRNSKMPKRWLFKTEPSEYSYDDLEREKKAVWDGVNNNLALKNLREVRLGDVILIYHTGNEKAVVGIAEAVSEPYPDPTGNDETQVVVNLKPKRRLAKPVTLNEIKANESLREFDLVRLPRLSVMPVTGEHWEALQEMLK
jgi:predicted RNA-binding protein with PUA-like domain